MKSDKKRKLRMESMEARQMMAGEGNDILTIKEFGLFVGDQARISGGDGFDSLYISAQVPSNLTKTNIETINGRRVDPWSHTLDHAMIGLTPRR